MKVLSLFSGLGAHDLGLERAGMTIIGQVENDPYCISILEKHWPNVSRWKDVKEFSPHLLAEVPDLITGGFPCQDISCAGKGVGLSGSRSGLWWEMFRIITEARLAWVLIENVPALRTKGADEVMLSLEGIGYTCWAHVVGAWTVGAPHRRNRVWIVAHANNTGYNYPSEYELDAIGTQINKRWEKQSFSGIGGQGVDVADTDSDALWLQSGWQSGADGQEAIFPAGVSEKQLDNAPGIPGSQAAVSVRNETAYAFPASPGYEQFAWEQPRTIKSQVGTRTNGTATRLALKAIGNANPPQIAEAWGRVLMRLHHDNQY